MTVPVELEALLVGKAPGAMAALSPRGVSVHRDILADVRSLQDAAARDGFALEVVSGYRDFDRQLTIWNQKARGERPVLDEAGQPMDPRALTPVQRLHALLRWSALPGASRHHWGTEIDVIDRACLPPGAQPRLHVADTLPGAMFAPLHAWLNAHLGQLGFFRPYDRDRGGIAPEPWHLSHVERAAAFQAAHSAALVERTLRDTDIELKEPILEKLEELYARYVQNVGSPLST